MIILHEYGHAVFDIVLQREYLIEFESTVNKAINNTYAFKNKKIDFGYLHLENGKFVDVLEYMRNKDNKQDTIGMALYQTL